MKHILTLYFGLVFSLCCFAENKVHWPVEIYKNAHPASSKEHTLDWMGYFIQRDFRDALLYAESHLLQRDLKSLTPQEFAKEIKTIARMIIQHPGVDSTDFSIDELLESAYALFQSHTHYSDLLASSSEKCFAETLTLHWLDDNGRSQNPEIQKILFLMPMEELWNHVRSFEAKYKRDRSIAPSSKVSLKDLFVFMVTEGREYSLEALLSRLICVGIERATALAKEASPFRTGGIFIFDDEYSDSYKDDAIRKYLGSTEFLNFILGMLLAEKNDETWSYPNIVVRISSIKDLDGSILSYAQNTLEKIRNRDHYKAAAFAHQEWIRLHPMIDGNGRMGRLLANVILVKAGVKPLIVYDDRLYTEATQQGLKDQTIFEIFLRHLTNTPSWSEGLNGS